MAIEIGVNSGFVTVVPTTNPSSNGFLISNRAKVTKDTSPTGSVKITEIGWYCSNETEEANFEVGLYAADGVTVPDEAGTLLFSNTLNAKGTTSGWKSVSVDWNISGDTEYWIGVSLDETSSNTFTRTLNSVGSGIDGITSTFLPNPYSGGAIQVPGANSFYALVEVTEPSIQGISQITGVQSITI